MKLEDQVSNKELSIRLRDLGVPQKSLFNWFLGDKPYVSVGQGIGPYFIASAFTLGDLGKMFLKVNYSDFIKAYYFIVPFELNHQAENMMRMFDVEICTKMLVYLLENKLIKL